MLPGLTVCVSESDRQASGLGWLCARGVRIRGPEHQLRRRVRSQRCLFVLIDPVRPEPRYTTICAPVACRTLVPRGAGWRYNTSSEHLSVSKPEALAGAPKTVVVGARRGTKQAARPHNADKVICIDRTTLAALGTWRNRHDPERLFFGPGYHPGEYVFTLVTDALRIRTPSDSGSTSRRGGCGPVHFLRWHYATHTQPAGGALKGGVSPKIISERIGPNTDASR